MWHRLRLLEIAEYAFIFASSVGFLVNYLWEQPIIYPLGFVLISLLINIFNRRNLGAQIQRIKFDTTGKIDKYQESISQIISELQNNINSLKSTTKALEINQREEKLKPLLETIKSLSNRLDIQEKTMRLLQAELNLFSQQFKQRPELQQINDLTSVIIDLQQFINKLPEWSDLRQQRFQKLEAKINQALQKLEENIPAEKEETDN
jgi:predicted PurR-regulated permease PerM